jgi:hypothetical protein
MVLGSGEHVHDAGARSLFAELHLQNRVVNRFSRDLSSQHVQLSMGKFKVGCRVFVLGCGLERKGRGVFRCTHRSWFRLGWLPGDICSSGHCTPLRYCSRASWYGYCFKDTAFSLLSSLMFARFHLFLSLFLANSWYQFLLNPVYRIEVACTKYTLISPTEQE